MDITVNNEENDLAESAGVDELDTASGYGPLADCATCFSSSDDGDTMMNIPFTIEHGSHWHGLKYRLIECKMMLETCQEIDLDKEMKMYIYGLLRIALSSIQSTIVADSDVNILEGCFLVSELLCRDLNVCELLNISKEVLKVYDHCRTDQKSTCDSINGDSSLHISDISTETLSEIKCKSACSTAISTEPWSTPKQLVGLYEQLRILDGKMHIVDENTKRIVTYSLHAALDDIEASCHPCVNINWIKEIKSLIDNNDGSPGQLLSSFYLTLKIYDFYIPSKDIQSFLAARHENPILKELRASGIRS